MIRVDITEAKERFKELMEAVETRDETVILLRDGVEMVQIQRCTVEPKTRELKSYPELAGRILYDPTEPASEEEWPEEFR